MDIDSKQTTNIAPENQTLAQVNANVADIASRVAAIEQREAMLFHATGMGRDNDNRESSRLVITGLFGLLGAKLGAAIGLKTIAFQHGKHSLGEGATWWERIKKFDWGKFFDAKEAFGSGPQMKKAFMLVAMTTGVGTLLGVAVGWARGRRVNHPKDILEHPIKTFKTLVMSEPAYEEQARHDKAAEAEEFQRIKRSWQEKIAAASSEPTQHTR